MLKDGQLYIAHSENGNINLVGKMANRHGLIAGATMRAVLGLAGVVDVLTKSLGSSNPSNVVKATFKAISMMSTKQQIMEKRGKAN